MSAYTQGPLSQVIPLQGAGSNPPAESIEPISALPQIGCDLETYFRTARQMEAALVQERSNARKYREELRHMQLLKSQVTTYQQSEKSLTDQLGELSRLVDTLRAEKRKAELDLEISKTTVENLKHREETLRSTVQSFQSGEKSRVENFQQATKELQTTRTELHRYQASWGQVLAIDRKAKRMLNEASEMRKRIEELTETLSNEKRRCENLDEMLKKEKREKQVALTCLHSAESRLAQVSKEVEDLREQKERSLDSHGLELNF